MKKSTHKIPDFVIKRFGEYLFHIQSLKSRNTKWISSKDLGRALGITSSTVRQDLLHLDFFGVSNRGYEIDKLEHVLCKILGITDEKKIVIIGAGNLGKALAKHSNFHRYGLTVCDIFDSDASQVGKKIGPFVVHSMEKLRSTVQKKNIYIGVLAVPDEAAQKVADRLIECGIKGILNFASSYIQSPKNVFVVHVRISMSLLELSCKIKTLENS